MTHERSFGLSPVFGLRRRAARHSGAGCRARSEPRRIQIGGTGERPRGQEVTSPRRDDRGARRGQGEQKEGGRERMVAEGRNSEKGNR
jgi:hypothetical protein